MLSDHNKSPQRRAVEQFLVHWIVSGLMIPVRLASLRGVRRISWLLAWGIGTIYFGRQRMMERNLKAVFGDQLTARQRRQIRKLSVINICKTMGELVKLPWMTEEDLKREITVEGLEHLDAALARGKGVVFITAHYGNWEYGGAVLAVMGYPMNVIARDAPDPVARNVVNDARRSKGVKVFGRFDVRHLLRTLAANECVAILPDQNSFESAVLVEFLGLPALTAVGPATFALRTGAAVVPGFASREPGDHIHLKLMPPLKLVETGNREADVTANTQLINDVIGDAIRARPEQWLWLHNRWKKAPAGDPKPA